MARVQSWASCEGLSEPKNDRNNNNNSNKKNSNIHNKNNHDNNMYNYNRELGPILL